MRHLMFTLALLGSFSPAQTTTSSITREVGPEGQRFFTFAGKCPVSGNYHPIQTGKVEVLKDKDGKNVKVTFAAPTVSDYSRKGTPSCAYRCAAGQDPIEIDGAMMCVGLR